MFSIQRLLLVGDCAVYRREWKEVSMLKYFVLDAVHNKIIKEFKTKNQAEKFAFKNCNLYCKFCN